MILKITEDEGPRSLLTAAAVRRTSRRILALADDQALEDWTLHREQLPVVADFVADVVREQYPSLNPPYHARWRHFIFAGKDLWAQAAQTMTWRSAAERARAEFDLAITSVLLDAGAGAKWVYTDAAAGLQVGRSEGLALASLRWFESGGLSANPAHPLRADGASLRALTEASIHRAFQSSEVNPLQGSKGRAALLNRLGSAVEMRPDLFAMADVPRPGGLFDALVARAVDGRIGAATILELLLDGLGPIWPNRPMLDDISLGDCWPHPTLQGENPAQRFVALHKLSQWLAYSLIEPLEAAGIKVVNLGELTGLAEYRNGGLFVDSAVLTPRDPKLLLQVHDVADPFIVGWRALTVGLLDELAPMVASRLGLTAEQFPLARVLEGGTWAAGRRIARAKRLDGGPPIQITSDGTVF